MTLLCCAACDWGSLPYLVLGALGIVAVVVITAVAIYAHPDDDAPSYMPTGTIRSREAGK
jgi:hypothetical protein